MCPPGPKWWVCRPARRRGPEGRGESRLDSDIWPGVLLLVAGDITFILVVAAEAGVTAGGRAGAGHSWAALAAAAFTTLFVLMLLQAFPRLLVSQSPERWQRVLQPFVSPERLDFRGGALVLDLTVADNVPVRAL